MMNKFNLNYIDSMRGIAILMVLSVHSTVFFNIFRIDHLPFNFEQILYSARYGVALFFIVSGYTLFRSLDIRQENGFKNYFIRRFFRIAPLYYVVLFVLYVSTEGEEFYLDNSENGISIYNFLSHLLFVNGFFKNYFNSIIGVEWTIFVEFSFYLILPLIYIYRKKLLSISFMLLILSFLGTVSGKIIQEDLIKTQLNVSPIIWAVVFTFGCLLYTYENKYSLSLNQYFRKNKNILLVFMIIMFISCSYLHFPGDYLLFSFLALLFFLLNKFNNIKIFNNLILKKIGELSFSIYLLHMPIFSYLKNNIEITYVSNNVYLYILFCLFAFILVILLSIFTYKFIEIPFMNYAKQYINHNTKKMEK